MEIKITAREMVMRGIGELVPYANNAKIHGEEQITKLRASLREFGFVTPVLIDEAGNIIAGHGRVMAARAEGMTEVPCVLAEGLSEAQRKAYILADNRMAEMAEWDRAMLKIELEGLDALDFGTEALGFDEEFLSDLFQNEDLEQQTQEEMQTIQDDEPEVNEESPTVVKAGDLWQLGKHRLKCGDSTSEIDFAHLMDGVQGRLCVTSPPYGVGMEYEEKGIAPWRKTISGVINVITKYCRIICWNIGDMFATDTQFIEPTSMYSTQYMNNNGFGLMYCRIWKKQGANFNGVNPYHLVSMKPVQEYEWILGYAKLDYEKDYEPVLRILKNEFDKSGITKDELAEITGAKHMYGHWFTPHQWTMIDESNYTKIQNHCKKKNIRAFEIPYHEIRRQYDDLNIYQKTLSDKDRSDWGQWAIWEIPTVNKRDGHPAAFPVELPARLIKMHSRKGDVVIEPFCGSGTTIIACEQLERVCYGMERDPRYCDVIIKRWEDFTGKKAVKIQ